MSNHFDQVVQDAAERLGYTLPEPDPEQEAAFEEWLSDPENKARWDKAIREAQERLRSHREENR